MFRKKVVILSLIVLITLSLFSSNAYISKNKSLTLNDALGIAYKEAINWDSNAQLYFMSSVDDEFIDGNYVSGEDGRRKIWNFHFVSQVNNNLLITIYDGKVVNLKEAKSTIDKKRTISLSEVAIDSTDAIKKAKSKFSLKPGKVWASGYHFGLSKDNGATYLFINGFDDDGFFARVNLNAQTGEITNAIHKVPIGGGLYNSDSGTPMFSDKSISIDGICVSPNYEFDNTLILWGYNNLFLDFFPIMYKSVDSGYTWNKIAFKNGKSIRKVWFPGSNNNIIYICCENQIFKSSDGGETWINILDTANGILNIDKCNYYIAALSDDSLYITSDYGQTWKQISIPSDMRFIEVNSYGDLFIANNESIYKRTDDEWILCEKPFEDNLKGLEIVDNILTAHCSNKLGFLDPMKNKWDTYDLKEKVGQAFSFKGQLLFTLSNGTLLRTKIVKGGDTNELIKEEIKLHTNEEISCITPTINNSFLYSSMPQFVWQDIVCATL